MTGTDRLSTKSRIVVGVDGSESSIAALSWAARQALMTDSAIEAITTWEWPTDYGWSPPYPADFDPADLARKLLEEIVTKVRDDNSGLDIRFSVVEGHPAPVLIHASVDADLLVVGCRGHGEFAGMLIGSVSEHCATHAHCPVLVHRDGR
jgi:nucleotide-binding universal stress UspA family protein